MDIRLKIISVCVGVITFLFSLYSVKRRKLCEDLALFWMILSFAMIILAVKFSWIEGASRFLGILDPNNLVFFIGLVFLIFVSFYFSLKISSNEKKLKALIQENALLKNKYKL